MSTTPNRRLSNTPSTASSTSSNGARPPRRVSSASMGTGKVGIETAKAIISKRPVGLVPTLDYSKGFDYVWFCTNFYDNFRGGMKHLRNSTSIFSSSIMKPEVRKIMLEQAVCNVVVGILASLPTGGAEGVPAGSIDWAETPLGWELRAIYWQAKDEISHKD